MDKRKNAADILSDPEALTFIMDNIPGVVWVTDGTGKIIFVNKQAEVASGGYPRKELMGMTSEDIINNGILIRSTVLEAIEKKESVVGFNKTGTGSERFNRTILLFDDDGNIGMTLTYSQDAEQTALHMQAIEKERQLAKGYKDALEYLSTYNEINHPLIAKSAIMQSIVQELGVIAKSDSSVLLSGESGTGKDVLANYIHRNSLRASEPFIPVNCAAVPRELMESEFFGYVKGAFTGASKEGKQGFFEMANRGTLFLDEIGELPLDMQSKLLQAAETKKIRKVGGSSFTLTDVRLVSATNKDLPQMVRNKEFREDLYYRLNVIPLTIPPLRERLDDVIPLAQCFLDNLNRKYAYSKYFSTKLLELFRQYAWPGNIRELKNVVERLVITSAGNEITNENMAITLPNQHAGKNTATTATADSGVNEAVENKSDNIIERYKAAAKQRAFKALLQANGNKTKAAKLLGISRGKLYKIINDQE